jgi:hypothetical protein
MEKRKYSFIKCKGCQKELTEKIFLVPLQRGDQVITRPPQLYPSVGMALKAAHDSYFSIVQIVHMYCCDTCGRKTEKIRVFKEPF